MNETPQLGLPLIAASQAQKHVTMNEALLRIDALLGRRVEAVSLTVPPSSAEEGAAWVVPEGASGDWSGHSGSIAFWINGGWDFASPRAGWSVFDASNGKTVLFDGVAWVPDAVAATPGGAATLHHIVEIDHSVAAGATSTVSAAITAGSQVIGVSARVIGAITGSATSWSLGVAGSANRYGSGLGTGQNSFAAGLSGAPVTYYSDTDLVLTAEGGSFASGAVRLAIHVVRIAPPRSV